jgi:putative heme transporter
MRWPTKRQLRRWWRPFRVVAGFVLLGLAAWVIAGKTSELSGASAFLTQVRWFWLALGALAELGSFVALASVQWLLLRSGGVRTRVKTLTAVTFAGSTIQAALPVGAAFAGLYVFRQYEFVGADEVLAGWVVIATFTVAFATLATLAGVGLAFAASTGTTFDLVGAVVGVFVFAILVVVLWVKRAKAYPFLGRVVGALERRLHRPPGQFTRPLARTLERMGSVAPARNEWLRAVLFGGADWVADCTCLAFAFLAVGSPVPWQGLLLAYCAAQLAVNLPITPGGLGVVEGTLTVALVAFNGGRAPTVAAVLLYRLLSFWIPIPIGAGCYLALARGRRRRERALLAAGGATVAAGEATVTAGGATVTAGTPAYPNRPLGSAVNPDGAPLTGRTRVSGSGPRRERDGGDDDAGGRRAAGDGFRDSAAGGATAAANTAGGATAAANTAGGATAAANTAGRSDASGSNTGQANANGPTAGGANTGNATGVQASASRGAGGAGRGAGGPSVDSAGGAGRGAGGASVDSAGGADNGGSSAGTADKGGANTGGTGPGSGPNPADRRLGPRAGTEDK